jgi:hydrogenase-1 operon protein HyaF
LPQSDRQGFELAGGGMKNFSFLDDDKMVDALLVEVAGLLLRLIEEGEEGAVDLLGLPLSPFCVAELERRLGRGEINAVLEAFGRSEVRETSFPGVWWMQHADESGRVIARLIEVAVVPNILRADVEDLSRGQKRLLASTKIACKTSRSAA